MVWRLLYWLLVPVVLLGVAGIQGRERGLDPGVLGAGFLGWLAVGLIAELVAAGLGHAGSYSRERPISAEPADGEVRIVPVPRVRSVPNSRDGRFRRIEAIEPIGGPRPRPVLRRALPPLLGRVVVFSIFLGRDGRGWSDGEIAEAHEALIRAAAWVEGEAIRHGAPVNIDVAADYIVAVDDRPRLVDELVFLQEGDGVAPFEAREVVELIASTSRAVGSLGIGVNDVADLIAQFERRVSADRIVGILHSRSAGRSQAVIESEIGLPGASLALCYASEADLPAPLTGRPFADPVTFVHELLHLFGAVDKYGVPLRTFPAGSVTSRDVMLLHEDRLGRVRIDPLTAREIGWASGAGGQ